MRTDQLLKRRLGFTVGLARNVLLRVAELHHDPVHGPVLFECVQDMLGIAKVAAKRPLLTMAQEDYVIGVLSLEVHAPLVHRVVMEIETGGAVPAVSSAPPECAADLQR